MIELQHWNSSSALNISRSCTKYTMCLRRTTMSIIVGRLFYTHTQIFDPFEADRQKNISE